jgi:ADP-dependent NAD(P)H-hydrate dehydratase / NAD(P)H-hydrate epimerase
MKNLYQVSQIRELERLAIMEFGISETDMMQAAGKAAFAELRHRYPNVKHIQVFCGTGNNAGDGYVLATLARQQGLQVTVTQVGAADKFSAAAMAARIAYQQLQGTLTTWTPMTVVVGDLLVDALLGIGLTGQVRQPCWEAIAAINAANKPVVALDIPSGLHADTGQVLGIAVQACLSVTFIGVKIGLVTGDAADYCGELVCHDLALPGAVFAKVLPVAQGLDSAETIQLTLVRRKRVCHKRDFGHVLVIGGGLGMPGAPQLAAHACLRVGAGLVTVATHPQHASYVSSRCPELMCYAVAEGEECLSLMAAATVIVLGPGLGQSSWAKGIYKTVLKHATVPVVLDADGLNLLAKEPTQRADWVLTPHPGEAARLLACDTATVQADRLACVQHLQANYGGNIVLKGAGTVVVTANGSVSVCQAGNPGMASAGMGDLLSGVLGGLLAQGIPAVMSVPTGVYLHAHAADLAANALGERGLLASDLLPWLQRLVNL